MNKKYGNRLVLCIEIVLTVFIMGMLVHNSIDNVEQEVMQYQSGLQADYERLISSYTTDFKMMVNEITGEIKKDVSADELEAFLQANDADYEQAIGSDIYDGISLMYKGRYVKSWNYGDYSDYDPNQRPWYQTAQAADGQIAVTAPYVTFLSAEELSQNDEYVVLTITQKYNSDIAFCYDIKTFGVNDLLSNRYTRYAGTFAMMYDASGYVLSCTAPDYYCHNVYQPDALVTKALNTAVTTAEENQNRVNLVFENGAFRFSYCITDAVGNRYLVVIPFWSVARQALLGTFLLAVLLIAFEIWIYRRTEKQRRAELEVEKMKNVSQMKQEFLARMSHDMRTPMNGILGLSELSVQENDAAVLRTSMAKIHSSGEYLLGLINDSLDLQKIESGKLTLNPTVVCTKELIGASVDMIRLSAEKKNIQFNIVNKNANIDGCIKIDVMRMRQIFVNLLSNAIKFTPPGGRVELTLEVLGRRGNIVHDRITVSDTGTGMSQAFIQNSLFKPFSQEHNALTDNTPGTGLGLSIVKKLVDLMGATISVESELGSGTTFVVDIDFECVAAPQESAAQPQKEPLDLGVLNGRHILLAEDHPLNAEIATKLLQKAGCRVTWVKNGLACCETFSAAAAGTYDMILMDIRMPELDGLEAARRIRACAAPDSTGIPILALSANAYEEDVAKSLAAGMNAHLSKPLVPAELYAAMVKWLKK